MNTNKTLSIKKCPSVRFNIFNVAWGEKNLANEVSFYSGLTYSPNDITNKSGTLVLRSSNVQNGEISLLDNVYVCPEVAYSQNVDIADIIVVVRNGSRSLIGKHAIIKKNMINTVIGAFMTGVKSSQPDFINALFDSNNFINQVNRNLGATINQITIGAFKEMSFNFPTVEEQTQIGKFFQNLDQSIALHEKKLSQTQNLKKAMLEKMFPKAGSTQPEIRLKGFSGEWEQRKLGDILKIKSGMSQKEIEVEKGRYPILATGGEIGRTDTPLYTKESVLIGRKGTIDKPYYMHSPFWTVDTLFYSEINDSNFAYFIYVLFQKINWRNYNTSTGVPSLTSSTIHDIEVQIPGYHEQKTIAHFFRQLDETLALQQQQLQTLKNIKQAFLGKMFV